MHHRTIRRPELAHWHTMEGTKWRSRRNAKHPDADISQQFVFVVDYDFPPASYL